MSAPPRALLPIYKHARQQGIAAREARDIAQREYARVMSAINKMGEHAPGPLYVAGWADEAQDGTGFADHSPLIADRRGYIIAAVSNDAWMSEANATAARLVECYNALAGIPDPVAYLSELRQIAAMMDRFTKPQ